MKTDFKIYSEAAYDAARNEHVITISVVLDGWQKSAQVSVKDGGHLHQANLGAALMALGKSMAYWPGSSDSK